MHFYLFSSACEWICPSLELFCIILKLPSSSYSSSFYSSLIQALKFYANQRQYFDKLVEISVVTLVRDGGSENGFSLSSAIVSFVLQKDGIQQTRDIYKRYVQWDYLRVLVTKTFFHRILCLKSINSSIGSHCRFLALPHPGLALHRHCIDLETNLASIGDKDGLINARKLYESALATYDQNVSLWQDYYRMETKVKFSRLLVLLLLGKLL